jgi:monomeric isocitrate dehydrogenase
VNPVLREGNSDREHLKLLKLCKSTSSFDGAWSADSKQSRSNENGDFYGSENP